MTNIADIKPTELPSLPLWRNARLPDDQAVYFVIDGTDTILYIGQAQSLSNRWKTHHRKHQLSRYEEVRIAWMLVSDRALLNEIEAACIAHFNPSLNESRIEYAPGKGHVTSIYLSDAALTKLDQIAIYAMTGMDSNRSATVEQLVNNAHATLKRIERVMDGRKLVGWNGFYGDHQVAFEEKTEVMARLKVDAYAHEELSK